MTEAFREYQPIVPIETVRFLGPEVKLWKWYPYPSRHFWYTERREEPTLLPDKIEEILSLASHKGLKGNLEAIDLTVGCRWPCQTCIRDSPALSSTMPLGMA